MSVRKEKILIIGAGIGGLATANLLAKDGHDVIVIEKNAQLGGRAGQFKKDGFTFDTGPSWYLMPEVFNNYYKLLGTTSSKALELIKLTPAYKVYSGDNTQLPAITITGDVKKDSKTFEALEPGAGEALKTYVKNSTRTYKVALKYFLYSNFENKASLVTKEILKQSKTFITLAGTPMHSYVKKYFKNPQLQQILEYPTVFLGSSPYSAPAIYSLMSSLDFDEGVFYPKGTMYAVPESLITIGTSLGVTYRTNQAVSDILINPATKEAIGVQLDNGEIITADRVISNADLHFTETTLIPKEFQSYPASYWAKKEASPSALLMYLGVKGAVPEFEHHTLLITDDWRYNFTSIFKDKIIPKPASLYISKTSQSDNTAPKGHENIFVLVPLPSGISITQPELEKLADGFLEQIRQTTSVDLKSRTVSRTLFGPNDFKAKYNSWQSSMLGPSHKLTQSAFFRTPNKSKKVKNLYYVGASTVPGVGVPMCLIGAQLVHERITKDLTNKAIKTGSAKA